MAVWFRTLVAFVTLVIAGALGLAVPATPTALADPAVEPAGARSAPDGPALAWLVADMDTGQILAARDPYVPHPPASTIKVLLALTALDELDLNSTVVATEENIDVECNCVGIKPGRSYTARQLLSPATTRPTPWPKCWVAKMSHC
jgi:D-alanyl-D-alanine carboxypeptidase (penicillin-binding protein 5/6)